MIVIKKSKFYLATFVIIASGAAFLFFPAREAIEPLKCKAFARVKMDIGQDQLIFSVIESVQFYDKNKGIIQYEGDVTSAGKSTYLARTVYLSHGVKTDKNTYLFTVDKVTASPLSNTPDSDFNQMWLENSGDNASIDIGVKKIRDQAYVISSTYSPQFVCAAY